jgi:transcriptional regulator NrdR family protein
MKKRLKVVKADGGVEPYIHTKVMAAIGNALAGAGVSDLPLVENLAEVVTYYIYEKQVSRIHSNEILAIIKAVLSSTGYSDAASALSEHYYDRRFRRNRTAVVFVDVQHLDDARIVHGDFEDQVMVRWAKSRIVDDVQSEHDIDIQTARAIASSVESKIFKLDISRVPASLIRQLVLSETAVMLEAKRNLEMV